MNEASAALTALAVEAGYVPIMVPSLWDPRTFADKARPEQVWGLSDRSGRELVLIPEVTGVVVDWWRANRKSQPKPGRFFYQQRCYRYERPQTGRYREFTQFGVELLEGQAPGDAAEVQDLLSRCLQAAGLSVYRFVSAVARNLGYYIEDGFEVEVPDLGAQCQVAGGGRYAEGIGWAIGLDRLVLARTADLPAVYSP
jgi:histidyl-tRNA synthetase